MQFSLQNCKSRYPSVYHSPVYASRVNTPPGDGTVRAENFMAHVVLCVLGQDEWSVRPYLKAVIEEEEGDVLSSIAGLVSQGDGFHSVYQTAVRGQQVGLQINQSQV